MSTDMLMMKLIEELTLNYRDIDDESESDIYDEFGSVDGK